MNEPDSTDPRKTPGENDAPLARLLGLGLQLTVTVSVFTALGWWLQKRFNWSWGMQGLGLVGIVLGMYFFVKEATR